VAFSLDESELLAHVIALDEQGRDWNWARMEFYKAA
jgi:hypothetical protein